MEQIAYYELQEKGLGALYLLAFEKCMKHICSNAKQYKIDKKCGIRTAIMLKFTFSILFREYQNAIQILALAHHRRRPQYWFGRIKQE
ncbi:MAG: type II toxin-antitoxin system RelE/ParE family toxin [Candidatus Thioglobus sp.]|nr:type II toxin-antitoxin system RelE/ParE family toxin [Candidatus Thioglobus sp.]